MSDPSTNILLDTCSVLNMINGKVLNHICSLPYRFCMGPIVYGECTKQPCVELEEEILSQRIAILDGTKFSVILFAELLARYGLGDGETECIAYGKSLKYLVCTDDRTARNSVVTELGSKYVIGTIGLLKIACEKKIIMYQDAFDSYKIMLSCGGFLPKLSNDFFC